MRDMKANVNVKIQLFFRRSWVMKIFPGPLREGTWI